MVQSNTGSAIVRAGAAFVNEAGSITNLAFGNFACISLIRTLAGKYRSRHYHQSDEHVLYVLEGRMLYWERELDGEYGAPVEVIQGESIRTGPLVVHQTYFPVNTVLISCSKKARDHETHESDVVRVDEPWCVAAVGQ
jgi:quercetin dioxygenase-like cupin family protein